MKIFKVIFLFLFITNVSFGENSIDEKINTLKELNISKNFENSDENDQIKLNLINELLAEKELLDYKTIESLYLQKIDLIQDDEDKDPLIALLQEYTNNYQNHSAQFMLCVETQIRDKFQPVECYQKSSKLITEYMGNIKKEGNEEYFLMFEFSKILSDYLGKLPTENACNLVKRANSFKNEKILLLTYFGSLELAKKQGILTEEDLNNLCYSEEYMDDYR